MLIHDRLSEIRNEVRRKKDKSRGHSSAGRAPALHAGGRRFDPAWLHHFPWLTVADRTFFDDRHSLSSFAL